MDSNVSKNTNSHNFFKLRFNQEKLGISVKNLLKQELLLILDLYQQEFNVQIEPKFLTKILEAKIAISQAKSSPTSRRNYGDHLSPVESGQFLPIVYAFPLGMALAKNLKQSPPAIMEQLGDLMTRMSKGSETFDQREYPRQLITEIVPLGWCNFYLDSQFMADWLGRSLVWSQSNAINFQDFLEPTLGKLFPAQYIHARCCNLLDLGTRENLITWSNLESISWLDQKHQFWLTAVAEHDLLQQLLITSDSWVENTKVSNHLKHWSKLALSLSQTTAIFLADCRFLGEVKQRYPHKAIARLGLIALVQFWLEKILVEKLRVTAPREV